jgi:transcription antitermination factor NusG
VLVLRIEDIVKITKGPFIGRLARFAGSAGAQRVLVVVDLHGREMNIEMDLDWIAATEPARKSVSGVDAAQRMRKPLT